MDDLIERLMGELKPICRRHGLEVTFDYAKCAFFATALRRMMTKRHRAESGERARYESRRYPAKAKLMRLFMRAGLANIDNLNKAWNLEAETLHRVAHEEGDYGGAITLEGRKAWMTAAQLTAFGLTNSLAGEYQVIRAEAGPDKKIKLRLHPVA